MVIEYIKRNHKKGYDEDGKLVYKVRLDDDAPVVDESPVDDITPVEEPVSRGLFG